MSIKYVCRSCFRRWRFLDNAMTDTEGDDTTDVTPLCPSSKMAAKEGRSSIPICLTGVTPWAPPLSPSFGYSGTS